MHAAVILTGAPGSGKSQVLEALSTLLEIDRVPYGAVEEDELSRGWPGLYRGQWLRQLPTVLALHRELGSDTFLVTTTTETEHELRATIDAIGAERTLVVCLAAPAGVVAERIAARESDTWPGKPGLIEHARELANQIPSIAGIDVILSTDGRGTDEVAVEIRELLRTRGIA